MILQWLDLLEISSLGLQSYAPVLSELLASDIPIPLPQCIQLLTLLFYHANFHFCNFVPTVSRALIFSSVVHTENWGNIFINSKSTQTSLQRYWHQDIHFCMLSIFASYSLPYHQPTINTAPSLCSVFFVCRAHNSMPPPHWYSSSSIALVTLLLPAWGISALILFLPFAP